MTIRTRLTIAFAVLVSIIALSGGLSVYAIRTLDQTAEKVELHAVPAVMKLNELRHHLLYTRARLFQSIAAADIAAREKEISKIGESIDSSRKAADEYKKRFLDEADEQSGYQAFEPLLLAYLDDLKNITGIAMSDPLQANMAANDDTGHRGKVKAMQKGLEALIEHEQAQMESAIKASQNEGSTMMTLIVVATATGVISAFLLGWLTLRAIIKPVNLTRDTVVEIEKSLDLTKRIPILARDEIGATVDTLNNLLSRLHTLIQTFSRNCGELKNSAEDMTNASREVTQSSSSQTESASSVAAAVEEMTASIQHIATSTQDANKISREFEELSRHGATTIHHTIHNITEIAESVKRASDTIGNLGSSTEKITLVVQMITDIADQTNLLALNAAIEAARAGEQGRGFAVVADEVRQLASRTRSATEEISSMINTIQGSSRDATNVMKEAVDRVDTGVNSAGEAREAINRINEGVMLILKSVQDISSAIQEQSTASNDISSHIERIVQMSEENHLAASSSEQSASRLRNMSDDMSNAVRQFRL